jgi:hypothetical protein
MSIISDLKYKLENQMTDLFTKHKVFFAFSDKQFKETAALHTLDEGDKFVLCGSGMVMPESNFKQFNVDFDIITKSHSEKINATPETRREFIAYELGNHEAYYTHDIDNSFDAISATLNDVTELEVWAVYYEELNNNQEG